MAIIHPGEKAPPPLPEGIPGGPSPYESEGEKSLSKDDFTILKVIGQGSFGRVYLVSKKEEPNKGKVFAMKVLSKSTIIARNELEHIKAEKSILMKLEFPFLVRLHYSFQTHHQLYFVMDYINGGELFYHLQKERKFTEERVRFYAAEIVAGLEYLHMAGVIYRDLKPENLLLTSKGHIVMTDFGLSKEGLHDPRDRTRTFCGTPEYLAPEILEGKGYGKAVDWWSFGTLLYEMLTGLPPFYSEDVQEMYTKIMSGDLVIPDTMSPEAGDFLKKLLQRNDSNRLQNPADIKKHAFFKEINWDLLLKKEITPPFIPQVAGEDDTSNIDPSFTQCPLTDNDDLDAETISAAQQSEFEGFTYNSSAQTFY
jgi:serine/threonine protein kinase